METQGTPCMEQPVARLLLDVNNADQVILLLEDLGGEDIVFSVVPTF